MYEKILAKTNVMVLSVILKTHIEKTHFIHKLQPININKKNLKIKIVHKNLSYSK